MKYAISTSGAPEAMGPYSQGTTAGRLIFSSGQLPVDPAKPGILVSGGIEEQTERVIKNIEALLAEVDCSLSDVAQVSVYLADLADAPAMNKVYDRYFTAPAPARTLVQAAALPFGALLEMDCIACR